MTLPPPPSFPSTPTAHAAPAGHPGKPVVLRVLAVIGISLIALGAVALVLGHLALPWAEDVNFWDVRSVVDDFPGEFSVFVQLYVQFLWIPFVIVPVVLAPLMWLGPRAARFTGFGAGLLGTVLVGGITVWILVGGVGTEESRSDFAPLIVGMAIGAFLFLGLSIAALLEKSGYVARAILLLGTLSLAGVHIALVNEILDDTSFGAWLPLIGYVLLGIGALFPLRYRTRTATA